MKQYDFFISYSTEDKKVVDSVVLQLESAGAKCWYAPRDVVGRYAKAIVDAIGDSKVFLLCLSKNAAVSEHVLNEVEMAYNKKKTSSPDLLIEPLCIESIDLDASEFDEIMYYIRRINFISPTNLASPQAIAQEVINKNKDLLKISNFHINKDRTDSLYFSSTREDTRLKIQSELLKKFDGEIYKKVFSQYDAPAILDLGSGNGDMIMDRISDSEKQIKLIGLERDEKKVEEANNKWFQEGVVEFINADITNPTFIDELEEKMEQMEVDQFDIIHISMLLLHLKSSCSLLRKCRRLLKPDGIVFIKDIDDGLNFAFPDDETVFERIYKICDNNETSGERRNGRQIYTNLYRAGFRRINIEKSGFSTIGLSYEEKEAFWGMYFRFILGDIIWMHEKYPNNIDIADDCNWYSERYDDIFEMFMKDDFVFSLGFQIYTAQK